MPYKIDETHDPSLESWVESANDPETDFPIQNLPLCRIDRDVGITPTAGTRVGNCLIALAPLAEAGLFKGYPTAHFVMPQSITDVPMFRQLYRKRLSELLSKDSSELRDNAALRAEAVIELDEHGHSIRTVDDLEMPFGCTDYTDFYASVFHATNVGSMFRPGNALLPNYKHIPIGYHGRASTVVESGTQIRRPVGQTAPAEDGGTPGFGPSKLFDYELEMGLVLGRGNQLGHPISIEEAEDQMLGLCLLNDWSARDFQKWEYQPLGPFLAKSFATSVSPYIVTMEALAPFRCPAFERPAGDPQPLPHLDSEHNRAQGGFDITLEVHLASAQMRERGIAPIRLSKGNFKDMYWTFAQMLAHHASNGCRMQPGDLLGSGTVSGKAKDSRGCLLELTWNGDAFGDPPKLVPGTDRTAIKLPTGEERKFLGDGDEVILKGYCEREGYRRIGFGECRGIVTPAVRS
ncbi:MAG: fumarylacetoacetase [Planctomycetota bacterium]